MPGIYVRTFGQSDWIQQAGSTALTVPGSYWLCHKNNIYKFIFKYHRSDRNTEEFNYGRDLMKIIRRVIKFHPKPGQQFVTRHLLVTYNHTGWTRQDKIFAMLKFKERPRASAFTHAFVLTVKFATTAETTECFMDSATDNECVPELLYLTNRINGRETITSHSSQYPASNKAQHTSRTETSTVNTKEVEKNIQITSIGTTLPKIITTISSTSMFSNESSRMHKESVSECHSPGKRDIKFNGQTRDSSVKRLTTPSKLGRKKYTDTSKKKKINRNQDCSAVDNLTESESNIKDSLFTDTLSPTNSCKRVDVTPDHSDLICTKDPMQNIENTDRNSKHITDDGNLDSVSLPYQYLIEKEIEKSKHTSCRAKLLKEDDDTTMSDTNVHAERIESNRILHNPIESTHADEQKLKAPESNDKKHISNGRVHRSSDITDLVMEGLMFTIREDKDSVAVIEQKTKLELDEVLENSEKVETKEGEKCLKNSSLLGLENLITMIDSPSHSVEKYKTNNVQISDSFSDEHLLIENSADLKETISHVQDNLTNQLQDSFDNNVFIPSTDPGLTTAESRDANGICMMTDDEEFKLMLDDDKQDMEAQDTENEEDEDIIPEALQTVVDKSSDVVNATLCPNDIPASNSEFDRDLLMDDIEMEGNQRNPTTLMTNRSFQTPHRPRIISNEIITVDQIPPALQVVLKNKLLIHTESRASKSQSFDEDCTNSTSDFDPLNKSVTHSCMEMREDKAMELASVTTVSPGINECSTENNNINVPVSKNEKPDDLTNCNRKRDNDSNIQQHRLATQTVSIRELKRLAPTGLQDITADCYQNLLQMQKSSNSIDHRCLRQRRRTGTINNSKNEEIRVEILKFIRDMTMGAKVVLTRISTKTIASILEKSSSV